jgi:prepilin signal peptidase PulO-like enzyme (type II secretory pathway)
VEFLVLLIIFVLGSCFGSFINMLVYRTAIKYKLETRKFKVKSKNRSFCDGCGRKLRWYENIPVISWLIQKGRTRCCQKKLPISYPIVELGTGILLIFNFKFLISNVILSNFSNFNILTALSFIFSSIIIIFLIFSAIFDWKYMILPDFSTVILIILALASIIFDEINIIPYLVSALGASAFLLLLNKITKGKGMGFGDVKLAVFMGLLLGWQKTILALYAAFILGAIFGILLMIIKKVSKKTAVPFGPFLIIGTIIAWWFGSDMINLFSLWLK